MNGLGDPVDGAGATQAAGVEDAGEQGEAVRAHRGAGAVADAPGDHVVPQLALGGIVGCALPRHD